MSRKIAMNRLTDKQQATLSFCQRHVLKYHNFPTVALIAKKHGVFDNAVHEQLKSIERKGYIVKLKQMNTYMIHGLSLEAKNETETL